MFGKLLKKLLGRKAGTVADVIVDAALNKATDGLAGEAERVVKKARRKV